MRISYEDARIRNLTIKISHAILENKSLVFNEELSDEELKDQFFFKESDIHLLRNLKLEGNQNIFRSIAESAGSFIEEHNKISSDEVDQLKKTIEKEYKEMKSHFESFKVNYDFIKQKLNQLTDASYKLHWYYLPVYDEDFIINRDIIPEKDLNEFYNHYHSIEDLYRYIFEPTKAFDWRSTGGDLNLGYKLDFKVFTCRWGHYDNYTFIRLYNGWKISAMIGAIDCSPNGEAISAKEPSGLYYILNQDSVQYPEDGVKYALSNLWKDADNNEMSLEELQDKLHDVANWISEVEKATHDNQPSWCLYY
ncbi:hypothetical protein KV679_01425 [Bacillus sp. JRC01]|nr:hypothetical protein [Bacillus sp. JRC01]